MGGTIKAIIDNAKVIELNPRLADAYVNRGLAYYDKNQFEKAIADYTKVIELNPRHSEAYIHRGIAYYLLGENNSACGDLQKACKLGDCSGLSWAKENNLCQ